MEHNQVFDAHFHLLFKHYITEPGTSLTEKVSFGPLASGLDKVLGGVFNSQASPVQVANSELRLGVTSLLALEHAFANQVLHIAGVDFSGILPLNVKLFNETRNHERSYWQGCTEQIKNYLDNAAQLAQICQVTFLRRDIYKNKSHDEIVKLFQNAETDQKRYLALSLEGGHNLSDVPAGGTASSFTPELKLKELQDREDIDIYSLNLCHLSYIVEQNLGGFAHGITKQSQLAFFSEEFFPQAPTAGLTLLGKKVIRQAYTHAEKPVLIDVKHMSVYTRQDFFNYRQELIATDARLERLPILCSHAGFTFYTLDAYLQNKAYKDGASQIASATAVSSKNIFIGRDANGFKWENKLFSNPWTINLYDEEIVEIMRSKGMIGLSLDQRILGAGGILDSETRGEYFEQELIATAEWQKLTGTPAEKTEGFFDKFFHPPGRAQRHIDLLCQHIIHAVRVGKSQLAWVGTASPWDCLCIGSDFDGLINPINVIDDVQGYPQLRAGLLANLPQADKSHPLYADTPALQYNQDGSVNAGFLESVVEKIMYGNGVQFMARYLKNWE